MIDIQKLRELYSKATPGEWIRKHKVDLTGKIPTTHGVYIEGDDIIHVLGNAPSADDINFVIAAHNLWPALIAEIERLRDIVERNQYLSGAEMAKLAVITKDYARLTAERDALLKWQEEARETAQIVLGMLGCATTTANLSTTTNTIYDRLREMGVTNFSGGL